MTLVPKSKITAGSRARPDNRAAGYGQIVLVLQGGGALGAYQAGVYHAMHEAGIEPDWVIGTSIGAINAGIIAGNQVEDRLPKLREFWRRVQRREILHFGAPWRPIVEAVADFTTMTRGIPGFVEPNPLAVCGPHVH